MREDGSHLGWGEKTNTTGVTYKGNQTDSASSREGLQQKFNLFCETSDQKKQETGENFISKLFIWWRSSHRSFLFLNHSPWLIYSSSAKCTLRTFKRGKIIVVEIFTKKWFCIMTVDTHCIVSWHLSKRWSCHITKNIPPCMKEVFKGWSIFRKSYD